MENPLEKIFNYFTGKDVLQYYCKMEEKFSEFYRQHNLRRQKEFLEHHCSKLPNLVLCGTIIYALITKDLIDSGVILGVSEISRHDCRSVFNEWKKINPFYEIK